MPELVEDRRAGGTRAGAVPPSPRGRTFPHEGRGAPCGDPFGLYGTLTVTVATGVATVVVTLGGAAIVTVTIGVVTVAIVAGSVGGAGSPGGESVGMLTGKGTLGRLGKAGGAFDRSGAPDGGWAAVAPAPAGGASSAAGL